MSRVKNKLIIGILGTFLILVCLLLFSNKIHYNLISRVEPEDLSTTDYVKLESGETVKQVLSISWGVRYLRDVEVILINLSCETEDAILEVKLRNEKERIIKKAQYAVKQADAGGWVGIPIGKTLYPGCEYTIEFSMQDDGRNDTPYLVTQEIEGASRYHRQLLFNDEETGKSAVIAYNFYDVIPFDMKLLILILCLVTIAGISSFIYKKDFLNLYAEYITPAVLLIMLIPIFAISVYSRPCVDDFSYSKATYELVKTGSYNILDLLKTAFEVDKQYYMTWQGLYTSAFLLALQPGIFGEKFYFLGAVGLLLFMYLTLYLSIWFVKKRFCRSKKRTWLWSLVLFSVIVQGMPSAVQGLYWYNGAVNYMPFVFLTILNMALLLEYKFSMGAKAVVYTAISAILSFIISGGNHVASFLNIMALVIACTILLPKKKIGVLFPMISALIGFGIMYRAPGTALRQGLLEKSTVLITIIESGRKCLENMENWINIQWLCYLLLLLPFSFEIARYCKDKKLKYHPIIVFVVSMIILVGMQCVPYYAMSYVGDDRLQNVIWVAFIVLSGINMTYLLAWFNQKKGFELIEDRRKYKFSFCAVICSLILCWFGNDGMSTSVQAMNEMFTTGTAQRYAFLFDERCDLMENMVTDEVIYVESLPHSSLLRFDDITDDIEDWRNAAWNSYYGKTMALK